MRVVPIEACAGGGSALLDAPLPELDEVPELLLDPLLELEPLVEVPEGVVPVELSLLPVVPDGQGTVAPRTEVAEFEAVFTAFKAWVEGPPPQFNSMNAQAKSRDKVAKLTFMGEFLPAKN